MAGNRPDELKVDSAVEIVVPQGPDVLVWGVLGPVFAIVPAALLIPRTSVVPSPWRVLVLVLWACFVGWPTTYFWSKALHGRVNELRRSLIRMELLLDEEERQYPGRLPWMPAWLGLFERALYCLLIGLDVAGGAAFIGVWVGIKTAAGWQVWSKGSTYGRATLFAGLLGNAMSVLFGVIAGLVIRKGPA